MKIEVVTLFPRMIAAALEFGIVGRAIARGLMSVATEDPRLHTTDAHRTVDDRPYGGGPGMVMKPEPLLAAIRAAHARLPPGSPRVYLSAQGQPFGQAQARELAALPGLLLLAGRYEGIDERLLEHEVDEEISVGDFVVSGGELPALMLVDAIVRQRPGVLNDAESAVQDSFAAGLLDCPHYTRPEEHRGERVPDVLLSGHHAEIRAWRLQQSLGRTWERRPDLLQDRKLSKEEEELLATYQREHAQAGGNG